MNDLLCSNIIIKEYREVLSRKKFGFSGETIEYLLSVVEKYGIQAEPTPSGVTLPDMKDLPFYEVVLENGMMEHILLPEIQSTFQSSRLLLLLGSYLIY